eukprot:scaffold70466_cov76-Phaeocystis_antarctica.AAC.6
MTLAWFWMSLRAASSRTGRAWRATTPADFLLFVLRRVPPTGTPGERERRLKREVVRHVGESRAALGRETGLSGGTWDGAVSHP